MKCKNIFGKKICKFGSGASVSVHSLPADTTSPVNINIYTSPSCKVCKPEAQDFQKRLRPIRNLVQVSTVNVEQNRQALQKGFLKLPSVEIGNELIPINATDGDILKTVKKYLPKEELL